MTADPQDTLDAWRTDRNGPGPSRREVVRLAAAATAAWTCRSPLAAADDKPRKTHFITLSFDDGFRRSSLRTAEIYEKFSLSACINVIATAHRRDFVLPNKYHAWPVGDFKLWNELQSRGHEIMPHGYQHADKSELPLAKAQELVRRCLEEFGDKLRSFDPQKAVFNFPFNRSTPAVEKWLAGEVMAFRTSGPGVNPLPDPRRQKLTCTGHGPDAIDEHLTAEIDALLAQPSGWLIYNTHGLDGEGWGPLRSKTLERLLDRLVAIPTVAVVPAARAMLEA